MTHPDVHAARIDTGFVEREIGTLIDGEPGDLPPAVAAVAAARSLRGDGVAASPQGTGPIAVDPWTSLRGWRN